MTYGSKASPGNERRRPVTADQPTLPIEELPDSSAGHELDTAGRWGRDDARAAWRMDLLASIVAIPFTAARYLLGGFARAGVHLRRLRDSFQHRGEHAWRDWLGRHGEGGRRPG